MSFKGTQTYLRSVAKLPTLNQTLFTINGTVSNATMIKPCTVFRKMIHTQRSTGTNQTKASPHEVWVCEISPEDRVRHEIKFIWSIQTHFSFFFLSYLVYQQYPRLRIMLKLWWKFKACLYLFSNPLESRVVLQLSSLPLPLSKTIESYSVRMQSPL